MCYTASSSGWVLFKKQQPLLNQKGDVKNTITTRSGDSIMDLKFSSPKEKEENEPRAVDASKPNLAYPSRSKRKAPGKDNLLVLKFMEIFGISIARLRKRVTIAFWMASPVLSENSIGPIDQREDYPSPALTGHLPIVACLLGYAMHRARSKGDKMPPKVWGRGGGKGEGREEKCRREKEGWVEGGGRWVGGWGSKKVEGNSQFFGHADLRDLFRIFPKNNFAPAYDHLLEKENSVYHLEGKALKHSKPLSPRRQRMTNALPRIHLCKQNYDRGQALLPLTTEKELACRSDAFREILPAISCPCQKHSVYGSFGSQIPAC
ncbi:hypothetical protein Tco_0027151 [Tanacetum coccineum]